MPEQSKQPVLPPGPRLLQYLAVALVRVSQRHFDEARDKVVLGAARSLARSMVARWGMASAIGPIDLRDSEEQPFLGREIAQPRRFSQSSARAIDQAVRALIGEAEQRARSALRERREALERLTGALEAEEDLGRERIESLLGPRPAALLERTPAVARA